MMVSCYKNKRVTHFICTHWL